MSTSSQNPGGARDEALPSAVYVLTRAASRTASVKHVLRHTKGKTFCGRLASLPVAELADSERLMHLPTCGRCAELNPYPTGSAS